ncbi:MAG: hypothetical protein ACT4PT_12675 [Methanobacteriota archaeon]
MNGGPLTLPTVDGSATFTSFRQVEAGFSVTDVDALGNPFTVTPPSELWEASGDGVEATIWSRESLVKAWIRSPAGDSWIEPEPWFPDGTMVSYRVYRPGANPAPEGAPSSFDSVVLGFALGVPRAAAQDCTEIVNSYESGQGDLGGDDCPKTGTGGGGGPAPPGWPEQDRDWECSDGFDNDDDGYFNGNDPGCWEANGDGEYPWNPPPSPPPPPPPACNDGVDNDGDWYTDYWGGDPGCSDKYDQDESPRNAAERTVYVYVDTQYRDQYGTCCWYNQIAWIFQILGHWFDDARVVVAFDGAEVDPTFSTDDIDQAWDLLRIKSSYGRNIRGYWSYREFDGCTIGYGAEPPATPRMLIQHQPEACHLNKIPGNDAEQAYLTAHEFGHVMNANHGSAWITCDSTCAHYHRSVMYGSAWEHYHACWSSANLNRITSYVGTARKDPSCD